MSAADDIQTGLDRIWSSDFVQKNPKKSYQAYHNDEYNRVKAYVEGGAEPSPWPITLLGDGLALVEHGRRQLGGTPPPPPPPGDVTYPASYYTGPLGQSNILPTKKGAFLVVWPGWIGGTWEQAKAKVLDREQKMGRKYDVIMTSENPPETRVEWIRDHGSIPCVHFGAGYTMSQIAAGQADSAIDSVATRWNSYGVPLIVRAFHEFNLPYPSYSLANTGSATTWVNGWKRFVDRVHAKASKVGFWWCPQEFAGDPERSQTNSCYPGDSYVDWVGTDAYNWQYVGGGGWASPLHSGWAEFWEIFDYGVGPNGSIHDQWGARKPFVVGETGTKYSQGYKGNWYRNIPARLASGMPYCTGVGFFDQDVSQAEPDNNWFVDYPTSDPDPMAGFVQMAKDPYFNTRA